jgi:hypothetical protein
VSRTATVLIASWVLGTAATAWLVHDDLPLSSLVGFILTFSVIEFGTMLEHPDDITHSPFDRLTSPLSARAERAVGYAFILLGLFAIWLISPNGGLGLAPPSLASPAAFVLCGSPTGIAFFLIFNARRKAELKAQEAFSAEEALE